MENFNFYTNTIYNASKEYRGKESYFKCWVLPTRIIDTCGNSLRQIINILNQIPSRVYQEQLSGRDTLLTEKCLNLINKYVLSLHVLKHMVLFF